MGSSPRTMLAVLDTSWPHRTQKNLPALTPLAMWLQENTTALSMGDSDVLCFPSQGNALTVSFLLPSNFTHTHCTPGVPSLLKEGELPPVCCSESCHSSPGPRSLCPCTSH